MGFTVEKVYFPCKGVRCAGLLYKPTHENNSVPGLVMGFGFGMVKEVHAEDLGPRFAEKGVAVLAFDYRRFGESGGEPRQALYPLDQVEDYRCAVNYMKTLDDVDSENICLWGSSFSGGHVVLQLAFPQPGVVCGVAQVPNLYSYKTAVSYAGSLEPYMELIEAFRDSSCKGEYRTISIVSKEGPAVLMNEEAYAYYTSKAMMYPTFRNYVTIDSLEKILLYNPGFYAPLVSKPIMIVLASRDTTTPPKRTWEVLNGMPVEKEVYEVDAGHFDLYEEPLLSEIVEKEAEFILKHVKGRR